MNDSQSGDDKTQINRHPVITNPELVEDADYSDEDAPPVEQIEADEGTTYAWSSKSRKDSSIPWLLLYVPYKICFCLLVCEANVRRLLADLLEELESDVDVLSTNLRSKM